MIENIHLLQVYFTVYGHLKDMLRTHGELFLRWLFEQLAFITSFLYVCLNAIMLFNPVVLKSYYEDNRKPPIFTVRIFLCGKCSG